MNFTCPGCGNGKATSKEVKRHHYVESGLSGVVLLGGVHAIRCSECRGMFLYIEDEQQLLQVIAIDLLSRPSPLSGEAQAFLRKSCDLTQAEMARLLGISRRETIAERESRDAVLPIDAEFHFRAIILLAFWEHVRSGHNSFLAPDHLLWLNRIRTGFFRLARRSSRKVARVKILRSEDEVWTASSSDRSSDAVVPAA